MGIQKIKPIEREYQSEYWRKKKEIADEGKKARERIKREFEEYLREERNKIEQ